MHELLPIPAQAAKDTMRQNNITRLTVDAPGSSKVSKPPQSSRWRSTEYYVYYAVLFVGTMYMIVAPLRLSQGQQWAFASRASFDTANWQRRMPTTLYTSTSSVQAGYLIARSYGSH